MCVLKIEGRRTKEHQMTLLKEQCKWILEKEKAIYIKKHFPLKLYIEMNPQEIWNISTGTILWKYLMALKEADCLKLKINTPRNQMNHCSLYYSE